MCGFEVMSLSLNLLGYMRYKNAPCFEGEAGTSLVERVGQETSVKNFVLAQLKHFEFTLSIQEIVCFACTKSF